MRKIRLRYDYRWHMWIPLENSDCDRWNWLKAVGHLKLI